MTNTDTDCVVIGAGVIGLAIARALAAAGRETIILERERQFGTGISSRNSEVIHAGLYYPPGSLKARLCVTGRRLLYDYCAARHIPHRRCGKLIVAATPAQVPELEAIRQNAEQSGVTGLTFLTAREAIAREPELSCAGALLSPGTGIIDTHLFMLSLLGDAEAHGAVIAYGAAVEEMAIEPDGVRLTVGEQTLKARLAINAAGLDAPALARRTKGLPPDRIPTPFYAKGNYFTLTGRAPFSHLIYPVPEPGGLGIHLTLDLAGLARFGPDVEWVDAPEYTVDPKRATGFAESIRTYWPGLLDERLTPGYVGVRPKLSGPGQPNADFEISSMPGLINLFGIESPGLTASLAIAEEVARLAVFDQAASE